jgi:hypothetical protein
MRLAFCFLSNNKEKFLAMNQSLCYTSSPYSIIDSYTLNVLFNPPVSPDFKTIEWNCKWMQIYSKEVFDMFSYRQASLKMAGNADIIFIGDDDFEFQYPSYSVIDDCAAYMWDNPDCGAIYLGGNFGGEGKLHGDEIYIANKGHLGTNRGIIVRNRPNLMENSLHALGANFDAVIGFTCLMQGYYVARRLHVPILHHTKNIMEENHKSTFYDLNYLRKYGIMSKINEVIGKWTDHAVWPIEIFSLYRQAAMVNGRMLYYDIDGSFWGC